MFALPRDIKEYVLRPLLDDISLLCIRVALYGHELKEEDFNYSIFEQIIQYGPNLIDRFWKWLPHEMDFPRIWAAHHGSIETLLHIEKRCGKSSNLCEIAVFTHHAPMGDLFFKRRKWSETGIRKKKEIHIPVLQWAKEKGYSLSEKRIWQEAAKNGHLEVIQWLKEQGVNLSRKIYNLAIQSGNLELLLYLEEQGFSHDRFSLEKAAIAGHIEMVQHCWNKGYSPCKIVLESAAYYGRLPCIKFLVEKGFPLTKNVYKRALGSNNLNLLEFLDSVNCPHSKNPCYTAALYGYLDSLKYLVKKGFPLTKEIFRAAAFNSYHFHVVEYLYEMKCPYDEETWNMIVEKRLLKV